MRAFGLESGTSLDGVDVALIEGDGVGIVGFGPTGYRPYRDDEKELLRRALVQGAGLHDRQARLGVLAEAEALVTAAHAETVEHVLAGEHIERDGIAIIGFHGQTVQIGYGAATFSALTAAAVARIVPHLPALPQSWIIAGGGNQTLIRMLAERLQSATVETPTQSVGRRRHWKRRPFAYLAVRTLNGLPLTFPGTTGVSAPMPGGIIARP